MAAFSVPSTGGYFGPVNASLNLPSVSTDFSDPAKSYTSAFNAARNINEQQHNLYMQGAAQQLQQYQAANQNLLGGYAGLQSSVMRRLAGSNRANMQDIADKYTRLSGNLNQQLVDRGLGNTTVQQSVSRGVAADFAKESTRSRGEFADLQSKYLASIGGSRLAAQGRGNEVMSGMQGNTLNYISSINAPYPDVGTYASLARNGGGGGWGQGVFGSAAAGLPGMPGPAPMNRSAGGGFHPFAADSESSYTVAPYGGYDMFAGGGGGIAPTSYASAYSPGVPVAASKGVGGYEVTDYNAGYGRAGMGDVYSDKSYF